MIKVEDRSNGCCKNANSFDEALRIAYSMCPRKDYHVAIVEEDVFKAYKVLAIVYDVNKYLRIEL